MINLIKIALLTICLCSIAGGCHPVSNRYVWNNVTPNAAYPQGYNFPVFVMNGEMRALNNTGWISQDGKDWTKTDLPNLGLNSAYQKFVQFKGAVYALGTMQGNYLNMRLSSKISRTRDFKTWKTLAAKSNLPYRVFYGAAVFKEKIWLMGGYDGKNYHNDIWASADGVHWKRVAQKAAWTPRNLSNVFVFKNRLWFIGGGVIDGEKTDNPNSEKEVWSSADGVNWEQMQVNAPRKLSGTPVVYDDKLWLIGANRNDGRFSNALYVSDNGINWQEQSAPWSPRGGIAAWVFDNKLYITGGKYSYNVNGEIKFVYSNDVWVMSKRRS